MTVLFLTVAVIGVVFLVAVVLSNRGRCEVKDWFWKIPWTIVAATLWLISALCFMVSFVLCH